MRSTSCVAVISNKRLVGLITERDIVNLSAKFHTLQDIVAAEVMTRDLITYPLKKFANFTDLIDIFQEHSIRHLPIVNQQKEIVGIITPQSIRISLQPFDLLQQRNVHAVMRQNIIHAQPEQKVIEIIELMSNHSVSCVIIGESNNQNKIIKPLGIITERDIVRYQSLNLNLQQLSAREVMTYPLTLICPQESLWNAHLIMKKCKLRRLVVVDQEKNLTGIITQSAILDAIDPRELQNFIKLLENQVQNLETEKRQLTDKLSQKKIDSFGSAQLKNQLFSDIALKIRSSLHIKTILQTIVDEVLSILNVDRVIVCRWDKEDYIAVEAVQDKSSSLPRDKFVFAKNFHAKLFSSPESWQIKQIDNINRADIDDDYRQFLSSFDIKAHLIIPIVVQDN